MLLLKGFDSVSHTLSLLSNNLYSTLQRVRELASHPHFLRYPTPISKKKNNNKRKKTKRVKGRGNTKTKRAKIMNMATNIGDLVRDLSINNTKRFIFKEHCKEDRSKDDFLSAPPLDLIHLQYWILDFETIICISKRTPLKF
ncbi:hypothetical protein HID58_054828 [Brassica napus]|uniref:Uncharacterized protein n=1 Tax=Brassica napus TaxID=3708 RepID=A0ABQ8AIR6_BRANA|nr:hypothetical protein HID58_054828 [Brassica napus]